MYTSPKCPGRPTMPLQINFNCSTFGVFTLGNQAKQLSADRPRQIPRRGPGATHRSFITRPRVTTTRRRNDTQRGGTGPSRARACPTAVGGVEKPCQALFGYSACPVPRSSKLKHLSREREKKSNEKNFLKEVE